VAEVGLQPERDRLAEAGPEQDVLQPRPEDRVVADVAEGAGDPPAELRDERVRRQGGDRLHLVLHHQQDAAGPQQLRRTPYDGHRVVDVEQDQPADDRVEAVAHGEAPHVAGHELDVGDPLAAGPVAGERHGGLGAVDADDGAARADPAGEEEGDVAGAAAEVEDAHAGGDPAEREEGARRSGQHAGLGLESGELGVAVPEDVPGGRWCRGHVREDPPREPSALGGIVEMAWRFRSTGARSAVDHRSRGTP